MLDEISLVGSLQPPHKDENRMRSRTFAPTINFQLDQLLSQIKVLDAEIQVEMQKSGSLLENMEALIEELVITAIKAGLIMLSSDDNFLPRFNELVDDCTTAISGCFDFETYKSKRVTIKNIRKITEFMKTLVFNSESYKFGEYPPELDKHLEKLRSETRKVSKNLENETSKRAPLPAVNCIDPEHRDSNWFSDWLWETCGITKRGDRAQRHELFQLIGRAAFEFTKIKSLQEQITSARNLMDIPELSEKDILPITRSPFYVEMKNYAIFMSRIFMNEVDSEIPFACDQYCTKFEKLISVITERTKHMDEEFAKWQREVIASMAETDAKISTCKANMKSVPCEPLDYESYDVPEDLHDLIDAARRSNSSNTSYLIQIRCLWYNFKEKVDHVKSAIEKCFAIHKRIFSTVIDNARASTCANLDVEELRRLELQEKYLTGIIETLQGVSNEQSELAESIAKVKSQVKKISTEHEKLGNSTARVLTPRDNADLIVKLDQEMIALRQEIINLNRELGEAEIELAEYEESEKAKRTFQGQIIIC